MKYKAELFMLLMAIALFSVSVPAFGYSKEPTKAQFSFVYFSASLPHPYRSYAIALVSLGLFMMITSTVLYRRHIKKNA